MYPLSVLKRFFAWQRASCHSQIPPSAFIHLWQKLQLLAATSRWTTGGGSISIGIMSKKEEIELDERTKAVFERKGYKVTEKISEGAFGKVYKARLISDQNSLSAVKVMDLDKMDPLVVKEFLPRELDIITKLHHPSILNVYDIIRANRRIYIFMDFAPNGCLTDRCKLIPILEPVAKVWFRQVTEAVHYMHNDMKICHRDIKTDNVLLDKNDDAKLTDYGFSRFVQADSAIARTMCGTAPYYSPELIKRRYDPFKADCWALGVLLFVMLTSRVPFAEYPKGTSRDWKPMLDCQENRAYRAKPQFIKLSDPAKDLIYHLLEPDPSKRFNTRTILKHLWTRIKL